MKYRIYGVTLMPYEDYVIDEYGIKEVSDEEEICRYCKELEKRIDEERKENGNILKEKIHYKKIGN